MLVGVASAAKPAVVKISLARPAVVYGSSVQLSGSVSNHQAEEFVFVLGRPYGTPAFSQLDMATTTAKGAWSPVQVEGNRPFTGKRVLIQRITASGRTTVKSVKLATNSSTTFTIRLPRTRARVRVVISTSQASPGYIAGYSNVWKSS